MWGGLQPVEAHGDSETISGRFLRDFGLLLGSPGDDFGDHLGARVSKWSVYIDFSVLFLVPLKRSKKLPKVVKKGAFLVLLTWLKRDNL